MAAPSPIISRATAPLPQNEPLLDLQSVNPAIRLDIRYATANNFTHRPLYKQARCLLRASVANQLSRVQADLAQQKLGLKVYDCYRPLSVQKRMWALVPDSRYVANPILGSRHNRGAAVDVTLVDREGNELPMPTGFDDFTARAHINYSDVSNQVRANRQLLEQVMRREGFIPLATEWWHFDAANWTDFAILDVPIEAVR